MSQTISRTDVASILTQWPAGSLTNAQVHDWATERFAVSAWYAEDGAVNKVLGCLDTMDIDLVTAEDAAVLWLHLMRERQRVRSSGGACSLSKEVNEGLRIGTANTERPDTALGVGQLMAIPATGGGCGRCDYGTPFPCATWARTERCNAAASASSTPTADRIPAPTRPARSSKIPNTANDVQAKARASAMEVRNGEGPALLMAYASSANPRKNAEERRPTTRADSGASICQSASRNSGTHNHRIANVRNSENASQDTVENRGTVVFAVGCRCSEL